MKIAAKPITLDPAEGNTATVPGLTGFDSILIHERGHNFGLGHSNGLDCGNSPILHPCTHIEYGNPFDRMGSGSASMYFNPDLQRLAGFKSERDFVHVKMRGRYQSNEFQILQVRPSMLGKSVTLHFEVTDVYEPETTPVVHELNLHIRNQHNAIIELNPDLKQ